MFISLVAAALLRAAAANPKPLPHELQNCAFSGRSVGNGLPGLRRNSSEQGIARIMKIVDPRRGDMLVGWAYFPTHGSYVYLQANDTMPAALRRAASRYVVTENPGNGTSLEDLEDPRNPHYSTIVAATRFPWRDVRLVPCSGRDWMNEVWFPEDP